MQNTAIK